MQAKLTITLPQDIRSALENVLHEEDRTPNDLIGQAVADYLFFRELRLLRERLTAKAQAKGILTEQDVFERVS